MTAAADINELKNLVKLLQKENSALQKELDSLKESTIITSMNDMRDAYSDMVKKNQELECKLLQYESNPLNDTVSTLKRKLCIYAKIFKILQKRSQRSLVAFELTEKSLRYLLDDDGYIKISDATFDGILMVQDVANSDLECFLEHELFKYKDCLDGNCEHCYRCDLDGLDDNLFTF
jgi:hypothetical protein